jgi:serine/threonine protein kinase
VSAEVGATANRYQILGKLAAGGMAEIFLARGANATGVERYCVLKRILRERAGDAQFAQMFLDEARLAAQLQHPNIASVYDIGMLGDSYFFTMEYVHGETVRSLLHRAQTLQRSVPMACVLTIAAGAAAGLHHAHERVSSEGRPLGIVHRDVSPSNLMVSFEGNVKIVDFGVAKADDRQIETQSGTVKGKISYLSPEQCRGARVDRRSDLFSLGIVMWEMLTGARLYRRNSDFENMTAIVHEPPPRPSSRRAEVPRAVDDIVMRLLAKSLPDRFQNAGEVVEAIENASMRAGTILSTSALSRLIRDLFGTRPEPWLGLGETQPHRVLLASRPLSGEFVPTPLDPIALELAAVPDLSVSLLLEDDGDAVSAPAARPAAPRPPAATPAAALPATALPAAAGTRAMLEAIAAAVPVASSGTAAPVTTLLGVSAPGTASAMAAIRQATAGISPAPVTTVRDLSPPSGMMAPLPLAHPTPSAPFSTMPRPAASQPPPIAQAIARSGPLPTQFAQPSQAAQVQPAAPPPGDAASSLAITHYRGRRERSSRFATTLIAIMLVAAAIGAVGAWLAMQ